MSFNYSYRAPICISNDQIHKLDPWNKHQDYGEYGGYFNKYQKNNLTHYCTNFICAGGIIFDPYNQMLLIVKGISKWSLPKGHRENNEFSYETAIREIWEETSMNVYIDQYYRYYKIIGNIYYKINIMGGYNLPLHPIDKNEISEIRWVKYEQLCDLRDQCNRQLKFVLDHWKQLVACV